MDGTLDQKPCYVMLQQKHQVSNNNNSCDYRAAVIAFHYIISILIIVNFLTSSSWEHYEVLIASRLKQWYAI